MICLKIVSDCATDPAENCEVFRGFIDDGWPGTSSVWVEMYLESTYLQISHSLGALFPEQPT